MNSLKVQKALLLAGVAGLMMMQPVGAEGGEPNQNTLSGDRSLATDTPYLREIKLPFTTVESWRLAQSPRIAIVGVQLEATETGLDILLETSDEFSTPTPSVMDNTWMADLPNAVLNLPEADIFQATEPAPGIVRVTVANQPEAAGVRIEITGVDAPPMASISTIEQGLRLSVTPEFADHADSGEDALRIIVTAQRTEEDVREVPISITVLTNQHIEDADIDRFRGVADNTPNYTVFDATGSRFFDYYSLRGLSNFNFASREAVGFFIDDVPYDYGGFLNQNLTDIERVEVLRGPQSTLYGRSAQAGAINVITRRPSNQFEFNGTTSYSSFENFEFQGSLSAPLVEDQLFFRLSGSYSSRTGYYENTFLNRRTDSETGGNFRGQILWTPQAEWEIFFNASVDDYFTDDVPLIAIDSEPFEIAQDTRGFNDLTSNAQSLRIAYSDTNLRFTSITTRRHSNQSLVSDLDQSTLNGGTFTNEFTSQVFSQEFRLQSPETTNKLQWLLGTYYESRSFNTERDGFNFGTDALLLFGLTEGTTNLRFADVDEDLFAVFGQASYDLTDALTVTAGLRYETITSRLDSYERIFSIPGFGSQTLVSFDDVEQNGDILLPRMAIEYRFNPDVMVYGSISRGYRPGGVNFRPENDENTLTFDPERSWNFEVGLKSAWLEDRLGLNVAIFHNPVNDYQVLTFDPITTLADNIINADASITGFEVEARATPLDGFDITAGFGLANADFTNYPDRTDLEGNALPFAPEFTYNLGLQYRDPSGIFGRIELAGLGTTFFDEDNTLKQDPYVIVNARLGYEFDQYGIYVFAHNLFDTEYTTSQFPFGDTVIGGYGIPATFGVQFRAKF
ncbi:MAG: TonB-dependent receptor [Cyanobacteria bacterium P01_G01_bin.54]